MAKRLYQTYFPDVINDTLAAARTGEIGIGGLSQLTLFVDFDEGTSGITQLTIGVITTFFEQPSPDPSSDTQFVIQEESVAAGTVTLQDRSYVKTVSTSDEKFAINIPIVGQNAVITVTPNSTSALASLVVHAIGSVQ